MEEQMKTETMNRALKVLAHIEWMINNDPSEVPNLLLSCCEMYEKRRELDEIVLMDIHARDGETALLIHTKDKEVIDLINKCYESE